MSQSSSPELATVLDLTSRLPRTTDLPTVEQVTEKVLNAFMDAGITLELIWQAQGLTQAEIRQKLYELTMLSGLFGQASQTAVELLLGVMEPVRA